MSKFSPTKFFIDANWFDHKRNLDLQSLLPPQSSISIVIVTSESVKVMECIVVVLRFFFCIFFGHLPNMYTIIASIIKTVRPYVIIMCRMGNLLAYVVRTITLHTLCNVIGFVRKSNYQNAFRPFLHTHILHHYNSTRRTKRRTIIIYNTTNTFPNYYYSV